MNKAQFVRDFGNYVEQGKGALFIGAGISREAGYPSWKELLTDIAQELGLDLEQEYDLAGVAQYYLNRSQANKTKIAEVLRKEFPPKNDAPPALRTLARLPIRAVWTTNYDTLIEKAWGLQQKHLDVKSRNEDLLTDYPWAHGILYKMHGTIDHPTEVVLAKNDYEMYRKTRAGFHQLLATHLISRRFLFLGFSFTDPNLFYVFSMIREAFSDQAAPAGHFAIVRRPIRSGSGIKAKTAYLYALTRHKLWVEDLERYGITCLEVDEYSEIDEVLQAVERRISQRSIMVSGSFPESGIDAQRQQLEKIAKAVGRLLAQDELRLVSGFGLTIGSAVISGLFEELYKNGSPSLDRAVLLRPFPQAAPHGFTRDAFNRRYREDLLSQAGVCIFIGGLKMINAQLVPAPRDVSTTLRHMAKEFSEHRWLVWWAY